MRMSSPAFAMPFVLALIFGSGARAHDIAAAVKPGTSPDFDVTRAGATTDGRLTAFALDVRGKAGGTLPAKSGKLPGAKVAAYVWPLKVDPVEVGFAKGSGLLAVAVTAHPDFDDTPLFDENGDGDPGNDGAGWHMHWVVLGEDKACGAGLKVRDISPGVDALPATAPGLPLALDSPGFSALLKNGTVSVTVPLANAADAAFDAVTAELTVNPGATQPLLCVSAVHKIASGDLSFPGRIVLKK